MTQKWHQNASVRAALAGGILVILAILGTTLLTNRTDSSAPAAKTVLVLGPAAGDWNISWRQSKYSFTGDEFVHPRIVEELLGWQSDTGETTTTIDLVEGNDSNRFSGDVELRKVGEHTWVECRKDKGSNGEGFFSYRHVGTSPSGVHILQCASSGGGSGIFVDVILLSVRADTAIEGWTGHLGTRERVLLHTLGSIALGDRYSGSVTYDRGVLTIGADESRKKFGGRLIRQEIPIE